MRLTSLNLQADRTKLAEHARNYAELVDQVTHLDTRPYESASVQADLFAKANRWSSDGTVRWVTSG